MASERSSGQGEPRLRLLEAIAAGLHELLRNSDDAAVEVLLGELAKACRVHRAFVAEHSSLPNATVQVLHEWMAPGLSSVRKQFDGRQRMAASGRAMMDLLARGDCVEVHRSQLPADLAERFAGTGLESGLTVPIIVGERCWGQLGLVDCERERHWSADDQATLRAVAATLGMALERRRSESALRCHLERLRDLAEATASIGSVEALVERTLSVASRHLALEVAGVLQIRGEDVSTTHLRYFHGPSSFLKHGRRVPLAREAFDEAVQRRGPTGVPDFLDTPAKDEPIVTVYGMRSFLGMPIVLDGTPYGAVVFLSAVPRSVPFDDADRDFVSVVGRWIGALIERDASTRRQLVLEEGLRESQKLESLAVALGGVAHDFGNLLMVIGSNLDLARAAPDAGGQLADHLTAARTATDEAVELTRQLFTFAGRAGDGTEPVDVMQAAEEVESLLRSVLPSNVAVEIGGGEHRPVVEAVPSQLRQVIMNLITNAVDAMRPHGGPVVITGGRSLFEELPAMFFVSEDAPLGPYGWFEVEDRGPGIGPDVLRRMFDPFFSTKDDGRGLGLASVLGIVRSHRGCIDVITSAGAGTRIRVYLPA